MSTNFSIVDVEFDRLKGLVLSNAGNLSATIEISSMANKHFLLCSCSYLEFSFCEILNYRLNEFIKENYLINNLMYDKSFKKAFYQYFNFHERKMHIFKQFRHDDWRKILFEQCISQSAYSNFLKAFCELFEARNNLVHNNYGYQTLDWTIDDIMQKYISARCFLFSLDKFIVEIHKKND